MTTDAKQQAHGATAPPGDLAQLVAMEQDLELRLAAAREEAASMVAAARREQEDLTLQFDLALVEARTRRAADLTREKEEAEARLKAEGARRAAWYDHLPEATEIELAGYAVDRLLARLLEEARS